VLHSLNSHAYLLPVNKHDGDKVCNESWEGQLTGLISWALTARNLASKVIFFNNKTP
jgi:hypothetical protein